MGESHTMAKVLIFLGLIFMFLAAINPGSEAAWTTFSASMQNFPSFRNPFDETPFQRYSSVPDGPTALVFTGNASTTFVGCVNSTLERQHCFDKDDQAISYMRTTTGNSLGTVQFNSNLSYPDISLINGASIRRYVWTVSCRTVNSTILPLVYAFTGGGNINTELFTCPAGNTFETVIRDLSTPSGLTLNWVGFPEMGLSVQSNETNWFVDVSFVRIDIIIGDAAGGCQAPEGAWFPWADEIACAIGQFGQIVWKGIQFITNGIVFIGQVLAYIVNIVVQFIALVTFFFTIPGAPSIIQSLFTVIMIGLIFFVIFVVMKVARGSGSMG